MDARQEQLSLKENPLPELVIIDPLKRVWDLDNQILELEEKINELANQKQEAMSYAIKNNISEDGTYKIDKKTKTFRSLNVKRFSEVFPDEYKMCCDIERKEKEEALNRIGEKINIGLVDKLIKKPALDAAQGVITVKEQVSYSVVKK